VPNRSTPLGTSEFQDSIGGLFPPIIARGLDRRVAVGLDQPQSLANWNLTRLELVCVSQCAGQYLLILKRAFKCEEVVRGFLFALAQINRPNAEFCGEGQGPCRSPHRSARLRVTPSECYQRSRPQRLRSRTTRSRYAIAALNTRMHVLTFGAYWKIHLRKRRQQQPVMLLQQHSRQAIRRRQHRLGGSSVSCWGPVRKRTIEHAKSGTERSVECLLQRIP
jgi:hypothetical protein